MRSSSVKTTVTALTLAAALTAVAVPAEARPAQSPRNTPTAARNEPGVADRLTAAVKRLYNSIFAPIANGVPVIPLPPPRDDDDETGTRTAVKKPIE